MEKKLHSLFALFQQLYPVYLYFEITVQFLIESLLGTLCQFLVVHFYFCDGERYLLTFLLTYTFGGITIFS